MDVCKKHRDAVKIVHDQGVCPHKKLKPYCLYWICAKCGRARGYHRQKTLQCPAARVPLTPGQDWKETTFERRMFKKKEIKNDTE